MTQLQDLLAQIGLEPERVRMFHMSSAMAGAFAQAAAEMTDQITKLGPSPLRTIAEPAPQSESGE